MNDDYYPAPDEERDFYINENPPTMDREPDLTGDWCDYETDAERNR